MQLQISNTLSQLVFKGTKKKVLRNTDYLVSQQSCITLIVKDQIERTQSVPKPWLMTLQSCASSSRNTQEILFALE